MNRKSIIGLLLPPIVLSIILDGCRVNEVAKILPDEIAGWRMDSRERHFGPDNLYDYINGGAELYLSYGFQGMINRRYSQLDQPDFIVDIFDMGSSSNAYGVFNHSREVVATDFGQGSLYDPGYLIFWRDKYLVSIMAYPETEESRQAFPNLAQTISAAIGQDGDLPEILNRLPVEGLVEESIRYFYHYIWQNSHYFIAEDNILNIDNGAQALLAKYGPPEDRLLLLLVGYPTIPAALTAQASFIDHFLPEAQAGEAARIEDGTWVATRVSGSQLGVVFTASSRSQAVDLLNKVTQQVPVE